MVKIVQDRGLVEGHVAAEDGGLQGPRTRADAVEKVLVVLQGVVALKPKDISQPRPHLRAPMTFIAGAHSICHSFKFFLPGLGVK